MSILDDAKTAVKLVQDIGNVEATKEIVNLQSEIVELVQERNDLKTKIQELEKQINLKSTLNFKNNMYYQTEDNGVEDGPFCSGCFDNTRKIIRLQANLAGDGNRYYECPICNKQIG